MPETEMEMEAQSFAVWAGVEPVAGDEGVTDVLAAMSAALSDSGGSPHDAGDSKVAAVFGDAATAAESAIVGQWNAQRLDRDPLPKLRIGVAESTTVAEALADAANGNQILMSSAVDAATGGLLDARPIGLVRLPGADQPSQLWLMTDSRPHVDSRPPRLDHLQ